MNRSVQIVVLSEDRQHECFARRFLMLRGYRRHQFRFITSPRGRGSGEQWVREHLPGELSAYRQRRNHVQICLLAIIDADNRSTADRLRAYEQACSEAGTAFREDGDRLAFAVPARNIESWLAYLRGETIDEARVYDKLRYESACESEAQALHAMCQAYQLREPAPQSLRHACEEFARLGL